MRGVGSKVTSRNGTSKRFDSSCRRRRNLFPLHGLDIGRCQTSIHRIHRQRWIFRQDLTPELQAAITVFAVIRLDAVEFLKINKKRRLYITFLDSAHVMQHCSSDIHADPLAPAWRRRIQSPCRDHSRCRRRRESLAPENSKRDYHQRPRWS